jgi:hypothetical protein
MPSQPDVMQNIADSFILSANDQGLEINPEKCKTITFCSRRASSMVPPVISLSSKPLTPVESIKILGVHFTADLKWSLHLDFVYKKCARASYLIKLLHQRGVSGRLLHSICNSLVFSHLTYSVADLTAGKSGICRWAPGPKVKIIYSSIVFMFS